LIVRRAFWDAEDKGAELQSADIRAQSAVAAPVATQSINALPFRERNARLPTLMCPRVALRVTLIGR
jgi:predicted membrane protein